MKDWFMSILGWLTIVSSGIVKVGDRIKIYGPDAADVLGDVLDVSPLKITIYEDVSLLSYEKHKRAGRIIFIPNNFIFTRMIFNYSHSGLQTVWDNITIALTYDSDIDKAEAIMHDIVLKYTKAFARLTDRQTNKLRAKYSIRAYSTEPRIFTFIEGYGIAMSVWFLTDSFKILLTKSKISREIFDAFKNEPSIKIAYPTSSVLLNDISKKIESTRPLDE